MPKLKTDKRSRLIETAANLTYQYGFGKTALADIAREAKVPLGNVYYYFKTKTEIGEAIIAQRVMEFRMMRQEWEKSDAPKDRLLAFIQMTVDNRCALARSGCPIGSLCSELDKSGGDLAREANRPFNELLSWIEAQFATLGKGREKKALALHLLSALQGVSLLANSFDDPDLVVIETDQLKKWIRAL
ncbi:TetR/AcrR family transcriptional regulator [Allomesorhizobium camelthorni]|uniref:TetR/AcrR family transcriptional regulator n=1 Tax=Allomesorhizobium camelthorni TaxID=475069 RepID=A0A6G4WAC1_9HYPH|nr:TetR/AcrR family transcriptional regulator [Mesorhizobium camelthorni]NGO51711.1 TetR/AcrR family transcriptional regulator [Mesorhizobium camelthorni]